MKRLPQFLEKNRDFAAIFIRLAFGIQLIYFTQDNVFSYDRMLEFRDFLQAHRVPYPLFCAFLSVIVQFTGGICLIIGFKVRPVSLLLIINFIMAILIVHLGHAYEQYYPALNLIAVSLFLLFNGAGRLSVDDLLAKREREGVAYEEKIV